MKQEKKLRLVTREILEANLARELGHAAGAGAEAGTHEVVASGLAIASASGLAIASASGLAIASASGLAIASASGLAIASASGLAIA
jgi:hypothetical protein